MITRQGKLCECGCGMPAPTAQRNDSSKGYVIGEPMRFVRGHAGRKNVPDFVVDANGCWIWQRGLNPVSGYGQMSSGEYAHRVMYRKQKGEIPEGMQIDHLCRVRSSSTREFRRRSSLGSVPVSRCPGAGNAAACAVALNAKVITAQGMAVLTMRLVRLLAAGTSGYFPGSQCVQHEACRNAILALNLIGRKLLFSVQSHGLLTGAFFFGLCVRKTLAGIQHAVGKVVLAPHGKSGTRVEQGSEAGGTFARYANLVERDGALDGPRFAHRNVRFKTKVSLQEGNVLVFKNLAGGNEAHAGAVHADPPVTVYDSTPEVTVECDCVGSTFSASLAARVNIQCGKPRKQVPNSYAKPRLPLRAAFPAHRYPATGVADSFGGQQNCIAVFEANTNGAIRTEVPVRRPQACEPSTGLCTQPVGRKNVVAQHPRMVVMHKALRTPLNSVPFGARVRSRGCLAPATAPASTVRHVGMLRPPDTVLYGTARYTRHVGPHCTSRAAERCHVVSGVPIVQFSSICRAKTSRNPEHLEVVTRSENARRGLTGRQPKVAARRLTDTQVREIRASAQSNRALASQYGVSHETIRCIRNGRHYKEIA